MTAAIKIAARRTVMVLLLLVEHAPPAELLVRGTLTARDLQILDD